MSTRENIRLIAILCKLKSILNLNTKVSPNPYLANIPKKYFEFYKGILIPYLANIPKTLPGPHKFQYAPCFCLSVLVIIILGKTLFGTKMAACVWNVSSFTTKNSLIRPPKLFAILRTTNYSQPYIASNRLANQCSTGI